MTLEKHKWFSHYGIISIILLVLPGIRALDCFKCVSLGGNNPACEDPFHHNYTADILEAPCWAGRKNRNGLFPATACIKLNGVYEDTGETMMIRGCALDSGTLTIDTEIVRMSHCGGFYFDKRYVSGCLQSCFEDACNTGTIGLHLSTVPWTFQVVWISFQVVGYVTRFIFANKPPEDKL